MKLTSLFVFAAVLTALVSLDEPVMAAGFENDDQAPAAFVEGTRDYTITYLEKSLAKLNKYFPEAELRPMALAIADLKAQNASLIKRIAVFRANKTFLKEKDADLLRYRDTLAEATDIMFSFFQRLATRTALPPR